MKIYNLDPQSNQLVCEGLADPSPLEPGVWLVPAHATTVEPPAAQDGKTQHFLDGAWVYVDIPPPPPPPPVVPLTPLEQIRALEADKADDVAKIMRQGMLMQTVALAMDRPEAALVVTEEMTPEEAKAAVIDMLVATDPGFRLMYELEQQIAPLRAQIP